MGGFEVVKLSEGPRGKNRKRCRLWSHPLMMGCRCYRFVCLDKCLCLFSFHNAYHCCFVVIWHWAIFIVDVTVMLFSLNIYLVKCITIVRVRSCSYKDVLFFFLFFLLWFYCLFSVLWYCKLKIFCGALHQIKQARHDALKKTSCHPIS